MDESEINALVRKLHGSMVAAKVSVGDSIEVALRLLVSQALTAHAGNREGAAAMLRGLVVDAAVALVDPKTKLGQEGGN